MTAGDELRASLAGLVALLRLDRSAPARFNISIEGFWRSFYLAAPIAFVLHYLAQALYGEGDMGNPLLRLLIFALAWISFPLVMLALGAVLGLNARYVPFIIVYNWSQLLPAIVTVLIGAGHMLGLVSPGGMSSLLLVLIVLKLGLTAYIAHLTLETGPGTAFGIALVDLLLEFVLAMALSDWL